MRTSSPSFSPLPCSRSAEKSGSIELPVSSSNPLACTLDIGFSIVCQPNRCCLRALPVKWILSSLGQTINSYIASNSSLESRFLPNLSSTNVESIRRIVVIPRNRGGLRKTLGHWTWNGSPWFNPSGIKFRRPICKVRLGVRRRNRSALARAKRKKKRRRRRRKKKAIDYYKTTGQYLRLPTYLLMDRNYCGRLCFEKSSFARERKREKEREKNDAKHPSVI